MQQLQLEKPGTFAFHDVQTPELTPGHALCRVLQIGVCGTDLHAFTGKHPFVRYPAVLGHEVALEIMEIDENSRGLAVGDRCALEPFVACGDCGSCVAGKTNCCQQMQVMGVHIPGCMQPIVSLPIKYLHKSSSLSLDQLAAIEPLSIGYHAVQRATVDAGERVLIVGAGPIGVAATIFAKHAGGEVTVQERIDTRCSFVQNAFDVEAVSDASERLFDVVIDATGHPAAMEESFERVTHGGRLCFVGVIQARISFDDALLHAREMTLLASRNALSADFPAIIKLIESGEIDPSPWVTHRLSLRELPEKFADLPASPGLVKAMIDMSDVSG